MKQEDEIDQRFAHLKKAVATYESRLGLDISILGSMCNDASCQNFKF